MGGFKRALLGYRRADVDAAFSTSNVRIAELEGELPRIGELGDLLTQREGELRELSTMVIERERDNRELREELRSAQERHDRSFAALEALSERLQDVQAQARGQATRIRMKALREAVEVSRRAQELAERASDGAATENGATPESGNGATPLIEGGAAEVFEGLVRVEIGPLADFSQLVNFEDAAGRISATSEISVERFSEGRATLAMRLEEPVRLLQALEQQCTLDFEVRRSGGDHVVLDVADATASDQRAA